MDEPNQASQLLRLSSIIEQVEQLYGDQHSLCSDEVSENAKLRAENQALRAYIQELLHEYDTRPW